MHVRACVCACLCVRVCACVDVGVGVGVCIPTYMCICHVQVCVYKCRVLVNAAPVDAENAYAVQVVASMSMLWRQ